MASVPKMNTALNRVRIAHYWLRLKCRFGFHYWVYEAGQRRCCLRGFCNKRQALWRDPFTRAWKWINF